MRRVWVNLNKKLFLHQTSESQCGEKLWTLKLSHFFSGNNCHLNLFSSLWFSGHSLYYSAAGVNWYFWIPCMDGLLQVMLQHFNWFKVRNPTWLCQCFYFLIFFLAFKACELLMLFVLKVIIKLWDKNDVNFLNHKQLPWYYSVQFPGTIWN